MNRIVDMLQTPSSECSYQYDEILHTIGKTEHEFVLSLRPDPPEVSNPGKLHEKIASEDRKHFF